MNVHRALLAGMTMLVGSLIVVELTASAVQMVAMTAESRQVAAWAAAERRLELAAAPAPTTVVEASLR
jgi:hypothetical protein